MLYVGVADNCIDSSCTKVNKWWGEERGVAVATCAKFISNSTAKWGVQIAGMNLGTHSRYNRHRKTAVCNNKLLFFNNIFSYCEA